jgi:predicted mannosyl-3-phosphoglycerate phosphatase (HAD superfamily)
MVILAPSTNIARACGLMPNTSWPPAARDVSAEWEARLDSILLHTASGDGYNDLPLLSAMRKGQAP